MKQKIKMIAFITVFGLLFGISACSKNDIGTSSNNASTQAETVAFSEDAMDTDFYGTWEAVELHSDNTQTTVQELEENKLYTLSDWMIIISAENNSIYIQTNNNSATGNYSYSDSILQAGKNKLYLEKGKLILRDEKNNTTTYYEKVSDNQVFPSVEKKELLEMLNGTWVVNNDKKTGSYTFADRTLTANMNGYLYEGEIVCIFMKENKIHVSSKVPNTNVSASLDFYYTLDNNTISLECSGETLTKQ